MDRIQKQFAVLIKTKYLGLFIIMGLVGMCSHTVLAHSWLKSSVDCKQILFDLPASHSFQDIVDIHGLEGKRAQTWLQQSTQTIQHIETNLMTEFFAMNQGQAHPYRYECLLQKKKQWLAEVQHTEGFGFVDLQTVFYPQKTTLYTTIEVIDNPKNPRMRFVQDDSHTWLTQFKIKYNLSKRRLFHHPDIIDRMQEFDDLSLHLLLNHQLVEDSQDCPAFHCVASFHHPQLQPYRTLFEQGVAQHKGFIISTLRNDPDPERRAAAAFLVGHFHDPNEILTLLSNSVEDSASQVRNNALRVMTMTLYKSQIKHVDCKPFIKLLDSPYVTDRNKALHILITLTDEPTCKTQIIRDARQSLTQLLQGTQPDTHAAAVILWQKIQSNTI